MKETLSKLKKIDNFILIKEGGSHWQAATVGWKLDLLKKKNGRLLIGHGEGVWEMLLIGC